MSTVLDQFVGETLEGPRVDALARALQRRLPSGAGYDAVYESVRYLAGYPLSDVEAYRLAWRLSGNIARLRAGHSVLPWASQQRDEWVPLEVLRGVFTKNKYHKTGTEFTIRVLAGSSCPLKVRVFWRPNVIRFVARQVGFSRSYGKFPFSHAMQLLGLRFYGRIEAAKSHGSPEFHEVKCSTSMIAWNRKHVLRLRLRVGEYCPHGWLHECHKCAVGVAACRAATHQHTYEKGPCLVCGESEVLFDPEEPTTACIACAQRQRLRRET